MSGKFSGVRKGRLGNIAAADSGPVKNMKDLVADALRAMAPPEVEGCNLYMMGCDLGDGRVCIKIGLAGDVESRLRSVQTACPFPLTTVKYVRLPDRQSAAGAERRAHSALSGFNSCGEWFVFCLSDPDHKAALSLAMRASIDPALGPEWAWSTLQTGSAAIAA